MNSTTNLTTNLINNGNYKASKSRIVMGNDNEKSVREALTKIWISQQRNETTNESFEEELNEREIVSIDICRNERQPNLPQLAEVEENQDIAADMMKDSFATTTDEAPYRSPSLLAKRRSEGENSFKKIKENISLTNCNSKLGPMDNIRETGASLKLPMLRSLSRESSTHSKESSLHSNDSSPLSTPPLASGVGQRTCLSDSLPRNFRHFHEEQLQLNTARSLPSSPRFRRMLVTRSSDLTCHLELPGNSSSLDDNFNNAREIKNRKSQIASPRPQKRRPGTPIARNLNYQRISGKFSRSCSDLHLINETASFRTAEKDIKNLFPSIAK